MTHRLGSIVRVLTARKGLPQTRQYIEDVVFGRLLLYIAPVDAFTVQEGEHLCMFHVLDSPPVFLRMPIAS